MIIRSIYALLATLCFGIIFNIRGKNLFFATLGGGIGWFSYELGLCFGTSEVVALFMGAVSISAYSEIIARLRRAPVTTFVICALIPLVPGGGMYYTMLKSIEGNVFSSLELGLQTLSKAGSIAVGVILTSSIARLVTFVKNNKSRI